MNPVKFPKYYYFISLPIAFILWFILFFMFNTGEVKAASEIDNSFISTVTIVFAVVAIAEIFILWKIFIPQVKKTGNVLLAYVLPEIQLVLGFVLAFISQSVTPFYYFIPFWLVSMAIVYRDVYSAEP